MKVVRIVGVSLEMQKGHAIARVAAAGQRRRTKSQRAAPLLSLAADVSATPVKGSHYRNQTTVANVLSRTQCDASMTSKLTFLEKGNA